MCGIGGILRVQNPSGRVLAPERAIPEAWLDIIDESIKHRGPDGHGRFRDRAVRPDGSIVDVALVHRRLSIIDHAGGHQPMIIGPSNRAPRASGGSSSDPPDAQSPTSTNLLTSPPYQQTHNHTLSPCPCCGEHTLAVVFNGCIYNHRELRRELEAAGHVFTTDHSDTEVLLHGWREWKDKLADHLDGMYAFAIWDAATAEFFGCRDLAGEKPLYTKVRTEDNLCLFASSPVGLTIIGQQLGPGESDEDHGGHDRDYLIHHIWFWFDGSDWALPQPEARSYAPDLRDCFPNPSKGSDRLPHKPAFEREIGSELSIDECDRMIEQAVQSRLEADTPIGCFLSGGVDSSLVALYAHRTSNQIDSFTVRMPGTRYDESQYAAKAAHIVGCRHHTLDCDTHAATDVVHLIQQLGLPFGDSSLLPTYWLSRETRKHVKVALSGDGADELFCGYERYVAALRMRWARWPLFFMPAALFPDRHPKALSSKIRRLIRWSQGSGPLSLFDEHDDARLKAHPRLPRRLTPNKLMDDMPRSDFYDYLPNDILRKTDTASMAVGLEVRAPFLSRELINRCLSTPLSTLMPGGQRKGLLRNVARKYFPPEIVDRPKMGFAIPIGEWFRSDFGSMRQLLYDYLESAEPFGPDALGINGMITLDFVRQLLREHDAAGENSLWPW
ncbi:MAG: asparagine synthase (glutamine-hydrolyzing), partial [Planctomycetes bacterium]|nr:asparagine synthase (glutamine-hydrolyzing) [Planctomycetota bacterium]